MAFACAAKPRQTIVKNKTAAATMAPIAISREQIAQQTTAHRPAQGDAPVIGSRFSTSIYCKFAIKLSSADLGGRVSDSGSVASGSSTTFR